MKIKRISKLNQSRFGPLETIVAVAVIVLVGAIGLYVGKHSFSYATPPSNNKSSVSSAAKPNQKSALQNSNANTTTKPVSVSVKGNQLINGYGTPVHLYGVDFGLINDYCAIKNPVINPYPIDQTTINTLLSWHINAVRFVINEDCWLGLNGLSPSVSGEAYQNFIENAVNLLNANGIVSILSLTQALPGGEIPAYSNGTGPLPDESHNAAFWSSLVGAFKSNPGVIFGAYGEPEEISWTCWLNGCPVTDKLGTTYQGVGMQQSVNTIRADGATQPILVGGVYWSNNLSDWLADEPTDPLHQLAADFHNYANDICDNVSCWNSVIKPVAEQVPLINAEFGEGDCGTSYIDQYMQWANKNSISYLAWSWSTGACSAPSLITDYDGAPTAYGAGLKAELDSLYQAGDIINFATNTSNPPNLSSTGTGSDTSDSNTSTSSPSSTNKAGGTSTQSKSPTSTTTTTPPTSSSDNETTTPNNNSNEKAGVSYTTSNKKVNNKTVLSDYEASGGIAIAVLLILFYLYWSLIYRKDLKLSIAKTKPPFFFKITVRQ